MEALGQRSRSLHLCIPVRAVFQKMIEAFFSTNIEFDSRMVKGGQRPLQPRMNATYLKGFLSVKWNPRFTENTVLNHLKMSSATHYHKKTLESMGVFKTVLILEKQTTPF